MVCRDPATEVHRHVNLCEPEHQEPVCLANPHITYVLETNDSKLIRQICQQNGLHAIAFQPSDDNSFPHKGFPACFIIEIPTRSTAESMSRLTKNLSRHHPVVAVATAATSKTAFALGKAGALRLLEFPEEENELLATIKEAWELDAIWHPYRKDVSECFQTLTRRERQVLQGVLSGKVNKQLASDYGVSPKTIEYHRANLMQKLRVSSVAELVRVSLEAGFR